MAKPADYSWVTQEMFYKKLEELVGEMSVAQLMAMPGFYEIASEELNNDALQALEEERDEERDEDRTESPDSGR